MAQQKSGWIYVRKNKTKPFQPGFWPEKKKLEVLTTYLATGNFSLTSKLTNVPLDTLKKWAATPWWKERRTEIEEGDSIKLDKRLENIVEKSLAVLEDRLENGEHYLNMKTGVIQRVPVKLRDAHIVTKDLIDRRKLLQKAQRENQSKQIEQTVDDRLQKLAETFASLALKQKPPEEKVINNVIEGEFSEFPEDFQKDLQNAIHDQREAGLQEGAPVGTQTEAQPSEG